MRPFIEVCGLRHIYPLEGDRQVVALDGVDLIIDRGEFVALIGPNGSGKSTLVRHLNGLLLPTAGTVRVDGLSTTDPRHLWEIRQRVGMVFQNPDNQFVASTVEEDVAFGPENHAVPPTEIRQRVDEALALVGLSDCHSRPPQMLSGGQRQLVAIAGALAARPTGIVLDEPTSMLDPPGRRRILQTIHKLNRAEGITVVLVTQSMEDAATARRVIAMHHGRIVVEGAPREVFQQGARLQQIGLDLPPAAQMAGQLQALGWRLPPGLLTVDELAAALC